MPRPNRLARELSPYLLQHQHNPVDWYPWGEEAFAKARAEDRPIFLSIGYATCHWCHVMERESFEDEEVAALLNEHFVAIKVDREERPDVDQLYMTVCQMVGSSCGWPLTVLLTPDREPFFVATYLPKESRFGRVGLMDLLRRVAHLWRERREEVLTSAREIAGALRETVRRPAGHAEMDEDWLRVAYHQLARRYDARHGGFGGAPKFPSPHNLLFLLRYGRYANEREAWQMAVHTLRQMRLGGLFDHVGFGFHRYATDARWHLPHFEKMLYDQALLVLAYTEAYQATGEADLARTAHEVMAYVLRDLTDPAGGFYSAEDADSEGREGAFYLWTVDELKEVLGPEEAAFVMDLFQVEEPGNFEEEATGRRTGENVLHQRCTFEEAAGAYGTTAEALRRRWEAARQKLLAHRSRRPRPLRDDKVLTDWNGLMIAALAQAARILDTPAYADAARRATRFLLDTLRTPEGRLLHRWRAGQAGIPAMADDYASLIWGLIELYETTYDPAFLATALDLNRDFLDHFWDEAEGGFFLTADDAEPLLVRQKPLFDGALPSANAIAMLNLLRLARMTGRTDLEARAARVGELMGPYVRQMPSAFTGFLLALGFAAGPSYEVVVAGSPDAEDTRALLGALRQAYVPNMVVVLRPPGDGADITRLAPFTAAHTPVDGRAAAYVCHHFACRRPTTDPEEMLAALQG